MAFLATASSRLSNAYTAGNAFNGCHAERRGDQWVGDSRCKTWLGFRFKSLLLLESGGLIFEVEKSAKYYVQCRNSQNYFENFTTLLFATHLGNTVQLQKFKKTR